MVSAESWFADWCTRYTPHIALTYKDNFFNVGAIDSLGVTALIDDMEQAFSVRFSQDDSQDSRFASIWGLLS